MPFVRIDAARADRARLDALSRAVHDALVETVGIPVDDRFHVLASHGGDVRYDNFLGVQHDEGIVFVSITLRAGRSDEVKKALYRRIAELAHEYSGTEPRNVVINLTENSSIDWSFGNGVAQYAG